MFIVNAGRAQKKPVLNCRRGIQFLKRGQLACSTSFIAQFVSRLFDFQPLLPSLKLSVEQTPLKMCNVVLQLLVIFVRDLCINQPTGSGNIPSRINKNLTHSFVNEKQLNCVVKSFGNVQLYSQALRGKLRNHYQAVARFSG